MTQQHDLGELLKVITRCLRRIINTDFACICLRDEDDGLLLRAAEGATTVIVPGTPLLRGLGERAIATGVPVWTADYLRDPALADCRGRATSSSAPRASSHCSPCR